MEKIKVITPTEFMRYYFAGYQVYLGECKDLNEFLSKANLKQYEPIYKPGFIVQSGNFFTAHLFKNGQQIGV